MNGMLAIHKPLFHLHCIHHVLKVTEKAVSIIFLHICKTYFRRNMLHVDQYRNLVQ